MLFTMAQIRHVKLKTPVGLHIEFYDPKIYLKAAA